ncbi:hypothetical protein LSH36_677g04042 [Paralvinella palmiformis]|uniref:Kazal-like domain-containing protein n=1 Tax=Paralvinella palmiformis TaxID=53620 RepID=A0AAD9MU46_9ANNE|nr:hypothetical protein LSH36_677g04042 [Paralvinella palmiformis]
MHKSGSLLAACRAACKSLFWASTPSASDLDNVQEFCPQSIVSCVRNYTQTMFISPEEAVPCCQYTQSESCRKICQQAMLSDLRDEEKYDLVTSECEEAALGTDMWNCLLLLSAKSKKVQYDHGGRIDLIVDQPCQMGCSDMTYCTNFNLRPMELFQSCNPEADKGAARAVQLWSSGTITLPYYTDQFIPIKDIRTCRPEVWKAIACTLYIKPCERRAPASQICRRDCIRILTDCMDLARLQPGMSPTLFCNLLSPDDDSKPCMSLDYYLVESPYSNTFSEITTPCNPNPCPDDEICVLRHRKCKHPGDPDCKQYQCKKGLPCNCPSNYNPVCASNGQTFPNECLAKCSGYDADYEMGSCQQMAPCSGHTCGRDELCIPRRDVCLSSKLSTCRQYECVHRSGECNRHFHEPACDTSDEEFSNVCTLVQRGRVFAHWGHCMSECAAWADRVYVDYFGKCQAVGQLLNLKSGEPSCPDVQCPALPSVGEIRVLVSPSQSMEAARVSQNNQITIRDVIEVLRQHISVLECDAFGYQSIERDLVLVIAPVTRYPTALQIQACMSEAEKIGSLITSRSPLIMMHLATSSFISAGTRTSHVIISSGATRRRTPESHSIFLFVCFLVISLSETALYR